MLRGLFASIVADVLQCLSFFTRIPVNSNSDRPFANALWAAPLVGAVVGAAGAWGFAIAAWLDLPASVSSAVALGVMILVTGGLHEDGLADVVDGFGGGATRERKLEIMKDSHVGTFGVLALLLTVLVRWSALAALSQSMSVLALLVAAHLASRSLLPAMMSALPPARVTGLSSGVGAVSLRVSLIAAVLGVAGLMLLGPLAAFLCAAALAIWFLSLKSLSARQIGGQTGDVLGTLQQGSEIVVLLVALSLYS